MEECSGSSHTKSNPRAATDRSCCVLDVHSRMSVHTSGFDGDRKVEEVNGSAFNEPVDEDSVSENGRPALNAVSKDLPEVMREEQRLRAELSHRECVSRAHIFEIQQVATKLNEYQEASNQESTSYNAPSPRPECRLSSSEELASGNWRGRGEMKMQG